MRSARTKSAVAVVAAAAAAIGVLAVVPASAAAAQPAVVSADPANFTPNVMNGKVKAIAQVGNTIVLGGQFTSVQSANGATTYNRTNLVAFDATTGAVSTGFAPVPSGIVEALAPAADGTSVYVAGAFTRIDGTTASRVARLNVSNGARVSGFTPPAINGAVRDMKRVGSRLYISGAFSTVGGQARGRMASLDAGSRCFDDRTQRGVHRREQRRRNHREQVRRVSGRFADRGDRQLRCRRRSAPWPGGDARHQWCLSRGHELVDRRLPELLRRRVFNTYMRDLDFSPNGDYFIVSTTGAYGGPDSFCDTITRWETARSGGGQLPTWTNHTGGDTTYAVTATGTAVYAGGHMRWVNNPYAGDAAGPGAVPREGIVALDPRSGLPFSWNPGRARGVGVFDMLATAQGLWVGSDTNRIGGETHRRIALMPLAGGKADRRRTSRSCRGPCCSSGEPAAPRTPPSSTG